MQRLVKAGGREVRIEGRIVRIARLEADGYEFLEDDPENVLRGLRNCGARADLFTFTQRILPDQAPRHRFPMEWDNFAAVPVESFEHWWNHQIRPEARNRARQAGNKGVLVREVPFDRTLAEGIWRIYNETPIRQGRKFPHYGEDLETVYRDGATFQGGSFFIGAFLGDELIGFAKLTADETRTQANLMNILSMIEHRDKAPTNALIAQAVRSCAERGIAYLVYQAYAYGTKQGDSLMKFKQVNGFQRFDVPRYYVPLTPLGRVALRLRLHRRLADQLPESLRGRLRRLRNAWHSKTLVTAKEPSK
jgi:hypothetical protein